MARGHGPRGAVMPRRDRRSAVDTSSPRDLGNPRSAVRRALPARPRLCDARCSRGRRRRMNWLRADVAVLHYTSAVTAARSGPERGWFVTLEGPEGAGKTTHAARLRDAFAEAGIDVRLVREPGGTPVGEAVRALLLRARGSDAPMSPRADALLFNAARAQLVDEAIRPPSRRGRPSSAPASPIPPSRTRAMEWASCWTTCRRCRSSRRAGSAPT